MQPATVRFPSLVRGTLLERHKRFLARVRLEDGSEVTASVLNPGRMTGGSSGEAERGYAVPNRSVVYLIPVRPEPRIKHPYRWVLSTEPCTGALVCVHTLVANQVIREALETRSAYLMEAIGEALADDHAQPITFNKIEREKRFAQAPMNGKRGKRHPSIHGINARTVLPSSRCDFCLDESIFIEVKSVTMRGSVEGLVLFPDAVSSRATRHLHELAVVAQERTRLESVDGSAGHEALVIFVVQRSDRPRALCPAEQIDPAFALAMRHAARCGVRFLCHWLCPSLCSPDATNSSLTGEFAWVPVLGPEKQPPGCVSPRRSIPVFLSQEAAVQYLESTPGE
jgi:sugar fermentation stimulation protein A